jgi:tRNA threonylcarbamoyladenosine biosynthesis protein TsaE
MKTRYITNNPEQTKKLGEKFAKQVLKDKLCETAFVIGLKGELGGGKTCFLQGFAKRLGVKENVLSPTFNIYKKFQIKDLRQVQTLAPGAKSKIQNPKSGFQNFYHFDCYRIGNPQDILDLGFQEIISNPKNIVAIEWPEKIENVLPKNTKWIEFEFIDDKKREIKIQN